MIASPLSGIASSRQFACVNEQSPVPVTPSPPPLSLGLVYVTSGPFDWLLALFVIESVDSLFAGLMLNKLNKAQRVGNLYPKQHLYPFV